MRSRHGGEYNGGDQGWGYAPGTAYTVVLSIEPETYIGTLVQTVACLFYDMLSVGDDKNLLGYQASTTAMIGMHDIGPRASGLRKR